jgi:hypothetical protein
MTACVWFVETTFVVGGGSSPAPMPRSTVTLCSTSVAFMDTLDATGGMPQSPPTVKRVGVSTWTGLMVVRVSSTRQGGTVKKLSARSGLVESPATATRASQPRRYLQTFFAVALRERSSSIDPSRIVNGRALSLGATQRRVARDSSISTEVRDYEGAGQRGDPFRIPARG